MTRSRARVVTSDPTEFDRESPWKKMIRAPVFKGPKRQQVDQVEDSGDNITHEECSFLASEALKGFKEAARRDDDARWKEAMVCELKSLLEDGTWEPGTQTKQAEADWFAVGVRTEEERVR